MRGIDFALNDICLAVFTTLAPGAALCYVALACTLLFGKLDERLRQRLESWLIVPLALATVGLVASASHLGTPSNALYVFRTVGSSPLATEVFCAVLFLGTSCSYWLGCVYIQGMRTLRRIWLLASAATGLLFIAGTALAYAMPTVVTWDTLASRVELPLTGLACMAPLALVVLTCSGCTGRPRLARVLTGVSLLATVAACAVMGAQDVALEAQRNAFGTAASLVPFYPVAIALFGICLAAANLGALRVSQPLRAAASSEGEDGAEARPALDGRPAASPSPTPERRGEAPAAAEGFSPIERRVIARQCLLCLLAYAATFSVRFCFYCFHMTSGVV